MADIERLKDLMNEAEVALESCKTNEVDKHLERYIKRREAFSKAQREEF